MLCIVSYLNLGLEFQLLSVLLCLCSHAISCQIMMEQKMLYIVIAAVVDGNFTDSPRMMLTVDLGFSAFVSLFRSFYLQKDYMHCLERKNRNHYLLLLQKIISLPFDELKGV